MLTSQYLTILTEEHLHEEWDEKKWIGVGKNYPASGEVPAIIEAGCLSLL